MATTQTRPKADNEAAGKKAAATRQRNEQREAAKDAGRKAAATRQRNDAIKTVKRARTEAEAGVDKLVAAARSVGEATVLAVRAVATRVGL